MSTLTGMALSAMRRAERVPIAAACPPGAPGWYALEIAPDGPLVFVGETADLAARLGWHRRQLAERGAVDPRAVLIRWVEAASVLGEDAWDLRCRRAIGAVLVSILQPVWDSDFVAAHRPITP